MKTIIQKKPNKIKDMKTQKRRVIGTDSFWLRIIALLFIKMYWEFLEFIQYFPYRTNPFCSFTEAPAQLHCSMCTRIQSAVAGSFIHMRSYDFWSTRRTQTNAHLCGTTRLILDISFVLSCQSLKCNCLRFAQNGSTIWKIILQQWCVVFNLSSCSILYERCVQYPDRSALTVHHSAQRVISLSFLSFGRRCAHTKESDTIHNVNRQLSKLHQQSNVTHNYHH